MLSICGIKNSCFLIIFLFIPIVFSQNNIESITKERRENILLVYNIIKYPTKVEIVDKNNLNIGISLDEQIIDFGRMSEGMSGKKYINIINDKDYIYKIHLASFGNISKMITFEKNNFLIESNKTLNISISLNASSPGNYTGEIDIFLKRFKYPIFNWLLKWI